MSLSLRILLAYVVLTGLSILYLMQSVTTELVPGMRQSLEEVLVDTANLLAESVQEEIRSGQVARGRFAGSMDAFTQRNIDALISSKFKHDTNLVVYVTDAKGIVLYDSRRQDTGKDYSQWNDVYLTLRGRYGARSTRLNPNDPNSSVMYVAAPVRHKQKIIGVVTVGKPSASVQPYFESAVRKIENKILILLLASLALVTFVVYWLTQSIRRLTQYAHAVQAGERVNVPALREKELAQLADAMEQMRISLEGKNYVENYLHNLTHELKSPLAAIQGAAELLQEEMPVEAQQRFVRNIANESQRLRQIVEQLLRLATLEKRRQLEEVEAVQTAQLITQLCDDKLPILQAKHLTLNINPLCTGTVEAERFLLQQAISNLLDNAIDFSPAGAKIELTDTHNDQDWTFCVRDYGPGIPEYALPRIFDRFYSLPRPDSGAKSTGLGLSLVQEVIKLHGGKTHIRNAGDGGAEICISLPLYRSPR
ncbi:MAG: two-component system sensor histidine kinase CreC [Gammaproteobacteria bacterium]|nr:two-component system sensor histidine kinase CreC [Gammaproteobacteria bacterium]MDH5651991.1 two-component system sensor histidine kinase CreC [Gammaproteobacteria bacterium]